MRTELTDAEFAFLGDLAELLEKHDAGLWSSYAEDEGISVGKGERSLSLPTSAAQAWRLLSDAYAPESPPRPLSPEQRRAAEALRRWVGASIAEQASRASLFADMARKEASSPDVEQAT